MIPLASAVLALAAFCLWADEETLALAISTAFALFVLWSA